MNKHEPLGPPRVEPLSDVAWSRIERGLWSRMDSAQVVEPAARPRRWIWLAAPAFAAAAAAVALVIAIGVDDDRAPGEASARLVSGASPTTLSYGDVHVTLDADSAAVMDHRKGAALERGAAWFEVAPRGERAPFVVTAGDTMVRVVGTRFRVTRSGEEAAVQVEHGAVEVLFRGTTSRVSAGQQWTSRQPAVAVAVRVAEAKPAPAPMPVLVPTPAPAPVKPAAVAKPAAAKPAAVAKPDDDASRYHRLEQLEVSAPKVAIDGYLELARTAPRWAEPALFAAARLAADRREPRAKGLLEIYLTRFPAGANADDARKLLDHLQGAH